MNRATARNGMGSGSSWSHPWTIRCWGRISVTVWPAIAADAMAGSEPLSLGRQNHPKTCRGERVS